MARGERVGEGRGEVLKPGILSKKDLKMAEQLGGAEDPSLYVKTPGVRYCDKGGHRERAIAAHKKDRRHWRANL